MGYVQEQEEDEKEGMDQDESGDKGDEKESSSKPSTSQILLLYQLDPGPASSSFGLNVARMAGIDARIIEEAKTLAAFLEANKNQRKQDVTN
jgi:DNA mismatch repair ATPase MutS